MTICITLFDRGYGPSIEDWRALRDQVLADQGARFELGPPRKGTGGWNRRWFGDVRDALEFDDNRVGCHIWLTVADSDRPLCRLLFELAERARPFVTVSVAAEVLRPPSVRSSELDWGPMRIFDIDSAGSVVSVFSAATRGRVTAMRYQDLLLRQFTPEALRESANRVTPLTPEQRAGLALG